MILSLEKIIEELRSSTSYYKSIIDNNRMDIGILYLEAGENDTQQPHERDEVYFILQGDGFLSIGDQRHIIKENTFFLIPKGTRHKFSDNSRPITAIYFFGA